MYSNGLWKTSFTDIPQSFLQLYYQSHQETNTYIKYSEMLFHKTSRWQVALAICARLDVSPKNVILQAVSPMQLGEGLSLVSVLPPKGERICI